MRKGRPFEARGKRSIREVKPRVGKPMNGRAVIGMNRMEGKLRFWKLWKGKGHQRRGLHGKEGNPREVTQGTQKDARGSQVERNGIQAQGRQTKRGTYKRVN